MKGECMVQGWQEALRREPGRFDGIHVAGWPTQATAMLTRYTPLISGHTRRPTRYLYCRSIRYMMTRYTHTHASPFLRVHTHIHTHTLYEWVR